MKFSEKKVTSLSVRTRGAKSKYFTYSVHLSNTITQFVLYPLPALICSC